jgi:hypothetical protein
MGVVAGCLLKAGELSQTTRERAPRWAVLRPGVLGSPCQCVTRQLPIPSHATRSRGTCTSLVGFDFAITIALRHIIIVLTMPMSDTLCTTYFPPFQDGHSMTGLGLILFVVKRRPPL